MAPPSQETQQPPPPTPTPPIVGRLSYRLQLAARPKTKSSRKRRRDNDDESSSTNNPIVPAAPCAGWVLVDEDDWNKCYLLSLPPHLRRTVSRVHSRRQQRSCSSDKPLPQQLHVSVDRYCTAVPLSLSQAPKFHAGNSVTPPAPAPTMLLEVDRLRILHQEQLTQEGDHHQEEAQDDDSDGDDQSDVWSLRQLARLEGADRHDNILKQSTKQYYTLQATVAAVSPVLTMDPNDPFLLLELRNDNNNDSMAAAAPADDYCCTSDACGCDDSCHSCYHSCVAVLRGRDMVGTWAETLQPGDCVRLRRVRKQAWRIPDLLMPQQSQTTNVNNSKPPAQVFVVDQAPDQIEIVQPSDENDNSNLRFATVLQGRIVACHFKEQRLHYLDLNTVVGEAYGGSNATAKATPNTSATLFLTYFPMSSSLQLSLLRPGAFVRAFHVQPLDCTGKGWAATLRSHVHVVAPPMSTQTATTTTVTLPALPYFWQHRISHPHADLWWRQRVTRAWPEFRQQHNDVEAGRRQQQHEKPPARNAYAEFFGLDDAPLENVSNNSSDDAARSCCHVLWSLDRIQTLAFQRMEVCLTQGQQQQQQQQQQSVGNTSHSSVRVGWTGSIHLSPQQMLMQEEERDDSIIGGTAFDDEQPNTSVLGTVGDFGGTNENNGGILSNGIAAVPVVLSSKEDDSGETKAPMMVENGQPALIPIRCVVVSCICLAVMGGSGAPVLQNGNSGPSRMSLPPYHKSEGGAVNQHRRGACGLVQINGHVYLVSIFLASDRILPLLMKANRTTPVAAANGTATSAAPKPNDGEIHDNQFGIGMARNNHLSAVRSISDALAGDLFTTKSATDKKQHNKVAALVGLLARSTFRAFRIKSDGKYSGCTLTLAHAPQAHVSKEQISVLQSIEIKPPIAMDRSRQGFLQSSLASLMEGQDVTDDQLSLGLVWWMLASSGRLCALLSGGWDEAATPSPTASVWNKNCSSAMGILVRLPSTSVVQSGDTRGYTRFRCKMADLIASVRFFDGPQYSCSNGKYTMDFVGGTKHLPGTLDRRVIRKQFGRPACGELLLSPVDAGIHSCTLKELFVALCRDLRTGSRFNLSPSLVRRVRGATFLGVSYCRVFAECTKCYAALRFDDSNDETKRKRKMKKEDNGIVSSVFIADLDRETYWHKPLPTTPGSEMFGQAADQSHKPHYHRNPSSAKSRPGRYSTPLHCPNNCQVDQYASIKWECSGTLDDGAGQARLFSERETSLCLMRLSAEAIETIEKGAWLNEEGIVFSKTMPPKAYLRNAVVTARSLAQNHLRNFRSKRPLQDKDVLLFLTPTARADYLLQHSCRSFAELRELDYFVRCKPVSDGVGHVKQTEIEVFPGNEVPTYTLPPLKLQLVDCCTSSENGRM